MLVAQLTDLHVVDPTAPPKPVVVCDVNERCRRAIESVCAESVPVDAVLLTGDLIDEPSEAAMKALTELLSPLPVPVLAVPGNHDSRELFRAAFDQPYDSDNHLGWRAKVGEVTFIGVDSTDPPESGGVLDDERLEWLRRNLAETADRPVALTMHHPPFTTGIMAMDAMGLANRNAVAEMIGRHQNEHGNLTRIFCGHLHRPITTTVGGVTASVGVATVHAVGLNLHPEAADLSIADEPAGYSLHSYRDGFWVSHTRWIHPLAPPIPVS